MHKVMLKPWDQLSPHPSSLSEEAELLCKYMQIHASNKAINMCPKPHRERFTLIKAPNGMYPRGRETTSHSAKTRQGLECGTESSALVNAIQSNIRVRNAPFSISYSCNCCKDLFSPLIYHHCKYGEKCVCVYVCGLI